MKIKRLSYRTWKVISGDKEYLVTFDYRGWHCTCEYFNLKKRICKHIKFVKDKVINNTPLKSP